MRSSDRISLSEISSHLAYLRDIWGGVFYHSAFAAAARKALGLSGQSFLIDFEGNEVGALNLLFRERPGLRVATTPLLFQYFGPVFFGNAGGCRLNDLDDLLSNQIDFAHFSIPPTIKMPSDFPGKWKIMKAQTPVVTGDELARWGNSFGDDVKNKINKARRLKIQIKSYPNLPKKLWTDPFSRRGMSPPIAPDKLSVWCTSLLESGLLRLFMAEVENEAIAFRGELIFGQYAYDWIAGSDPRRHSTGANQLLMAEIGDNFAKLKLSAWDLVGSEVQSIADFKRSFGARDVTYFHASRSFNFKGRLFELARKLRHA